MKIILILLAIAGCVLALTYDDVLEIAWKNFKEEYQKVYKNRSEEQLRKHIFKNNKREIDRHNSRYAAGKETYEMGVNAFTDMTSKEFEDTMLMPFN